MSKQIITKSSFLQDLEDGLTRKEMAAKYDVTEAAIKKGIKIFGLENSKPKKKIDVDFVDDTTEFKTVHITEEQIAEKAVQMEEIVTENIQEEQMKPLATDIKVDIFGVTPEMMAEAFENTVVPDPIVEGVPQPTFEEVGFPMVSNYYEG